MSINRLIFLAAIFIGLKAHAQNESELLIKQAITSPYQNFFEAPRERVYIHFNRSEYLAGDNIWFKAYVYNPMTKQLAIQTNKLYAELYDSHGKLVERKILFVEKGLANSYFKLKDNLEQGYYTFRAYTNWMRNFTEQPFYSSEFLIRSFSPKSENNNPKNQVEKAADLQVFPEGGLFVKGIDNHFGVKLTLSNGHGCPSTGYILDSHNDTLETFKTNHLGFGDFTIREAKKHPYKIGVRYEGGKQKEIVIAEPVDIGISMMANTTIPSKILISVKGNQETVTEFKDKNIYMMVHNNGTIYKASYLKISEAGFLSILDKSQLGPGINYITLFNHDFKPLAERLIFNDSNSIKGTLELSNSLQNDSLSITVRTSDLTHLGDSASLSLSVLPELSTGNSFPTSLYSDLLLNSSIKGDIESPHYYTEADDIEHQKDLDNLLLTQGWRRYEWNNILMKKSPEIKFPAENGFTVEASSFNLFKGKGEKNSKVTLFSPQNKLVLINDVDDAGHTSFPDLYLADSSAVVLSAANLKGSGTNRNLKVSVNYLKLDSTITTAQSQAKESDIHSEELNRPLIKSIELNEVIVSAKKDDNPFKNNLYSSVMDKAYVITEKNFNKYNSIESLLRGEFFLGVTRSGFGNLRIKMNRGVNFTSGNPALIVDGMVMEDLSLLTILDLSDIEAIAINRSGAALLGSRGADGSINIITRKKPAYWAVPEYNQSRILKVKGYEKNVEFFTPKYLLDPETPTYQKYASIYWKPNIQTDATGQAHLKFAIPKELKTLTIRLEGMSQEGTVYYQNQKINLKSKL